MAGKPKAKKPAKTVEKPISVRNAASIRKQQRILDLYEGGASIRQIATHLTTNGFKNCSSTATIHKHLRLAVKDEYLKLQLKAKEHVALELAKIGRVELAHLSRLCKATNPKDIALLAQALAVVWRRRDALLGLNKPLNVSIKPNEALAKLLGRSPEEFPSGDVES